MRYALGIDTSNYKTSIALVDEKDNILYDDRRFLNVPEGERGLRQQEALFQHVKRLPRMIDALFREMDVREEIDVISVSTKPRNMEGSYMPCFEAGLGFAKTLSASLNKPLKEFSHQEGHIASGVRFSPLRDSHDYIAFHFSGGTTEVLKCTKSEEAINIEIIGGTKDISYGQLIDRAGVKMGYPFPAGEEIDYGAIRYSSGNIIFDSNTVIEQYAKKNSFLPVIKVKDNYINLSGIETAILKYIDENIDRIKDEDFRDSVSLELLNAIGNSIYLLMQETIKLTGLRDFLFVGGVSSSSYLRSYLNAMAGHDGIGVHFASPELASDNAVGIAFLGGDSVWL